MKWFRNKEMLRNTLEENDKLIEETCSQKFIWSLKDYNNLVKDHLELLEENETLNKALDIAKVDYTTTRINLDNASARIKDLEKEYQELKEDLKLTTIERTNCEDKWYKEHLKCCELEKEYQELKEDFTKTLKKNTEALKTAINKIDKLKKAIEILKDKLNLHLDESISTEVENYRYYSLCADTYANYTKQEYNLLKEVLE